MIYNTSQYLSKISPWLLVTKPALSNFNIFSGMVLLLFEWIKH